MQLVVQFPLCTQTQLAYETSQAHWIRKELLLTNHPLKALFESKSKHATWTMNQRGLEHSAITNSASL